MMKLALPYTSPYLEHKFLSDQLWVAIHLHECMVSTINTGLRICGTQVNSCGNKNWMSPSRGLAELSLGQCLRVGT